MTRLDGSTFEAPVAAGSEVAKRLDGWVNHVTPDPSGPGSWCSSIHPTAATRGSCPCSVRGAEGTLLPIEAGAGRQQGHQAAGRRAGPAGTHPPRAAPTGRAAPRARCT